MKLDIGGNDTLNFRRGMPVHFCMLDDGRLVQVKPPPWWRRAWRRLTAWRRPVTFQVVTNVDVAAGSITVASVPGRWSFRRWKWVCP